MHEVWPLVELESHAIALGHDLAAMPKKGVAGMPQCLVGSEDITLEQLIAYVRTALNFTRGFTNSREGMQAFLEKRKPIFDLDLAHNLQFNELESRKVR